MAGVVFHFSVSIFLHKKNPDKIKIEKQKGIEVGNIFLTSGKEKRKKTSSDFLANKGSLGKKKPYSFLVV